MDKNTMNTAKEVFSLLQSCDASEKLSGSKIDKMHKLFNLIVNERNYEDFCVKSAVDRVFLFIKYIKKDYHDMILFIPIIKKHLTIVNKYTSILEDEGYLFMNLNFTAVATSSGPYKGLCSCKLLFIDLINANAPIMFGDKLIYDCVDRFFIQAYMNFFYKYALINGYYVGDKFFAGRQFEESRRSILDYNAATFAEFKLKNTVHPIVHYRKDYSFCTKEKLSFVTKEKWDIDIDIKVFTETELLYYWNLHNDIIGEKLVPDGYIFIENCGGDYELCANEWDEESKLWWNYHKFAWDIIRELSIRNQFDNEVLKGYKIVLFKPLQIINTCGFNNDNRGSDVTAHNLAFADFTSFNNEFTLYELGNALYNMKSHKFENWYEMWCDEIKFKIENGTTIAKIIFDHGS